MAEAEKAPKAKRTPPFRAEYTAEDVLTLYRLRKDEGDEGRLRTLAATFRELTRLDHKVSIPKQYQAITKDVRTPFVRDAWHRITSSLVAKPPVIHITPKDDARKEYRDAANLGERFDMAMIERINKERGTDIVYNLTAQLVRDGESVLKVVHRPDAWANFPERSTGEDVDAYLRRQDEYKRGVDLPLAWSDLDRLSIVAEGGEYGDEWIVEYGEYAQPYLKNKYGMRERDGRLVNPRNTLEGKPSPEGLCATTGGRSFKVEFFTSREWHVIIDGSEAPGFPKRNPYAPHLPYFRAPAYDSESLLYSLMFLVPRMDELLTMKLNWSYLGSYPNPVLEPVASSNAFPGLDGPVGNAGDIAGTDPKSAFTWTPGKLIVPPEGKRLTFLSPPPVGKDLNDLVLILKNLIDVAGVPAVMRGVSGSGDSGYLANQLRSSAEMSYKLASLAAQRQLEKAVEFSHWLIANRVQQTVYVLGWDAINPKTGKPKEKAGNAWLGLSPESQSQNVAPINKLGPVSFQYRPTLPTDEQARAMIALQLTNAEKPLYDRRHALETWMQEEDPESILDAIYVEQALSEEPLASMVIQQALDEAGIRPPGAENPAAALVDQFGNPLIGGGGGGVMPPAPGQIQGNVPMANGMVQGTPAVPGITMPLTPGPPQGIPGNPGGRVAGTYPGQPGGPNL